MRRLRVLAENRKAITKQIIELKNIIVEISN